MWAVPMILPNITKIGFVLPSSQAYLAFAWNLYNKDAMEHSLHDPRFLLGGDKIHNSKTNREEISIFIVLAWANVMCVDLWKGYLDAHYAYDWPKLLLFGIKYDILL
jgi:hypothetical protein